MPVDETASGDGVRKLFYLRHVPFQDFSGVDVNSTPVPRSNYCFDPLTGYVSLRDAPPAGTDNITFHYVYSRYPDLGVTNWEQSDHNYLFFNTTATGIAETTAPDVRVGRSLFRQGVDLALSIPAHQTAQVAVYSETGRLVALLGEGLTGASHSLHWDGRDGQSREIRSGLYFVRVYLSNGQSQTRKLVKLD